MTKRDARDGSSEGEAGREKKAIPEGRSLADRAERERYEEQYRIRPEGADSPRRPEDFEQTRRAEREAREVSHELNQKVREGKVVFGDEYGKRLSGKDMNLETAQDTTTREFWTRHGNTPEFYRSMAEHYPRLEHELVAGRTKEELLSDKDHKVAAQFWYSSTSPIRANQFRGHHLVHEGVHRAALAKEYQLQDIPVRVRDAKDHE